VEAGEALLLADYGLGVLSPPIAEHALAQARARAIPVVVDSRYRLGSFRGATVAVPNEVEAMEALGIGNEAGLTDEAAMRARVAGCGLDGMIVTRGSLGMVVCDTRGGFETIGIAGSLQATDVTGAGDTVAAMVALSLAAGATLAEAARMATFGASVVVMKRGTATASPEEVRRAIAGDEAA
jgi:D-beta-D-heptose 7-phosphate kinase/D-beta-D-heptose 1-phosphate adenosyltransferase